MPGCTGNEPRSVDNFQLDHMTTLPVTSAEVAQQVHCDPEVAEPQCVAVCWWKLPQEWQECKDFFYIRLRISVYKMIVSFRVIEYIYQGYYDRVLANLHERHQ
jgi:hypothetical protein